MDVRDSLERLNSEAVKVFPNDTPNIKMQKTCADVTGLPKDAPASDLERYTGKPIARSLPVFDAPWTENSGASHAVGIESFLCYSIRGAG
jgi:hypothetical protein